MAVNQYGLDVSYFKNCIERDFIQSGIGNYTPDEFARICLRMAVTADEKVLAEPEFAKYTGLKEALEHNKTLRVGLESANKQISDFNWIGVK